MDNKDKEIEELKEKIYQLEQNLGQCENGYSLELHTARMIIRSLEQKVANYEKKLKKSVEFPCNVGDYVYYVDEYIAGFGRIDKYCVQEIKICKDCIKVYFDENKFVYNTDFGRTCFLHRTNAVERLEEIKGEQL